ncbi:hypothetical protein [Streptomyces sp. JJ36]|uniref:hypothetical protein n=1 Tax=Streptomyces sp. JJ36 TaxID=2736645 RepID=UPI001F31C0B5|nr:hypothetical protein [Streptomyces sp. JJ36]MCF6523097.1 hypothetical protein [Streptomyces sp. JJ36]
MRAWRTVLPGRTRGRERAAAEEAVAAGLAARLRQVDAEIRTPEGLWERVCAAGPHAGDVRPGEPYARDAGGGEPYAAPARAGAVVPEPPVSADRPDRPDHPEADAGTPVPGVRRWWRGPGAPGVVAAAVAVAVVVTGSWWLLDRESGTGPAAGRGVTLSVYNAEEPCRDQRTQECALRLARNPYERYAAPGNRAALVWHGDRLPARCVVVDGTLVTDESGISSTRWYRVRAPEGTTGWLPGVRTRNEQPVRDCRPGETPPRPG